MHNGKRTMPVSAMASRARSADEDCENLQKTTPLDAMRSILQYCSSGHRAISSCVKVTQSVSGATAATGFLYAVSVRSVEQGG